MKKFLIVLFVFLFVGCGSKLKTISKTLDTNLDGCKIVDEADTHSGFLGDGELFAKIECSSYDNLENWKDYPLTKNILTVMDMEQCDYHECLSAFQKYKIPVVAQKYYFVDRQSKSSNKNDDSDLNKRNSYNFSIGIFDGKNIYFYEMDT